MATRRTEIRQWEIDKTNATKLVKRLTDFVNADPETKDPKAKKKLMTDGQVKACIALLKKYLPDLKAIEHSGNPDHPVVQKIVREIRIAKRVSNDGADSTDGGDIPTAADPE